LPAEIALPNFDISPAHRIAAALLFAALVASDRKAISSHRSWSLFVMLEVVWPTLPAAFRDELTLQCVKQLKSTPAECDAFAQIVANIIKARAQTVKSQWRLSDIFGTSRAIARDPQKASPFFAIAYMTARSSEVTALYSALNVEHKDLAVADSSAVDKPPTQTHFAAVLAQGLPGVSADSVRCMIAVIADAGIDAWQTPARDALTQHLAATAKA
jgi:hypothetical protein